MIRKAIVLILLGTFGLTGTAWAGTYSGGTGEPNSPYKIATANDLNDIGNHIEDFNDCFILVNDINMAGYNGTQFNIIGALGDPFTGVFDGNGHTISNFSYEISSGYSIGLFRIVDDPNAVIKNLSMVDPNINGGTGDGVGALVGELANGTISGCAVQGGRISGRRYIGGLVGQARRPYGVKTLTNCYSKCTVSGDYGIGGVVGVLWPMKGQVTIRYCSSTGSVSGGKYVGGVVGNLEGSIYDCNSSAVVSGDDYVGGLVGSAIAPVGEIINCSAVGNVTATGDFVGGLVGENMESHISDCCEAGDVEGSSMVGGLIGYNYDGGIINCHATGNVRSDCGHAGGLVGRSGGYRAIISDCYSTGTVSATPDAFCLGGLVGDNFEDGTITDCYATGDVNGLGLDDAGGLAGRNKSGIITSCYANGSVSGFCYIAGLVGENLGAVINCFAGGSVDGNEIVAGLIADNVGEVANCYAAGSVSGDIIIGGLVGENNNGSYTKCFWDSDMNPDVNGIGNTTDPNVIGKTTVEMSMESTFTDAGWDFVEVWGIGEGQTYPFLRFYPAGDLNHDGRVDFFDVAILADDWLAGTNN